MLRLSTAAVLGLLVIWRWDMSRGGDSERALWFVLAMFTCSETMQHNELRAIVDRTVPIPNAGAVVVLGTALLGAISARRLFFSIVTKTEQHGASRHRWLAGASLLTLTWSLVAAPAVSASAVARQADYYSGGFLSLLRWSILLGWITWAMVGMSRVTVRYARQAPTSPLRTGLILGAAGTVVGFGYIVIKATVVWAWFVGAGPRLVPLDMAGDAISCLSIFLICAAAGYEPLIGRVRRAVGATRDNRSLRRLEPLWTELLEVAPLNAARFGGLPARTQVIRLGVEILDVQLHLFGYIPEDLPRTALAAAERAGLAGPVARAAAQAACLRVGRRAKQRGALRQDAPAAPLRDLGVAGRNLDEVIFELERVAAAYLRDPFVHSFADQQPVQLTAA